VVVTGIGVVSPAGTGVESFWQGLRTTPADRRERTVDDFDPSPWLSGKEARHLDRFTQFAVAAGQLALDDAGGLQVDPARAGVQLGTGIGGAGTLETQVGVLAARGPGRVSPFTIPMVMPNAGAAAVSLRFGLQGPSETLTTACAAGTHSVAAGARMVADGRCDVVLAGGAEASMTPTTVAAFTVMTALSRTGLSRLALDDAELDPQDVRAVNAHGTSTPLNDAAEAAALRTVFGAGGVPVSSIKGVTGHGLGAAGALEAASVLLSFVHRELPPTLGTTQVDPELELDLVLEPRAWEPGPTVSNSFGFGGHNGSLVLGPA
jgi:3-oxoacyl-[acyl-carrier-protein] synthase II